MTISEIAKLAEVSSAAVSRYLNGGSLSEEKRNRIKAVIEETGYVPSEYARTLRTKKTYHVGVIVPNIKSSTTARIVSGIGSVLQEKNYHMVLADTDNDAGQEVKYLEFFGNGQMDGVIYIAGAITRRHMEILKRYRIPVVVVGQMVSEFDCVYHDDFHAARDMVEVLLESGCRRPGMIFVAPKDKAAGEMRIRGAQAALGERGFIPEAVPCVEAGFTLEDGYEKMEELLKKRPDIDGVFCATDSLAVGAVMYLKEAGKRIPQDIRICSVGNNQASDIIDPRLSTAHYHYRTSGIEAARMLISKMRAGEERPRRQLMLGYEVLRRESTGTAADRHVLGGFGKRMQMPAGSALR